MKARTKVLLTSIASIAMCASIAVGGTYALFTDKAVVNVAVTSGTVDVSATIKDASLKTYSRGILQSEGALTGSFANDASGVTGAVVENGELKLTNITPGDKAEFVITVTNASNVDIQYRTVAYLSGTGALKDKLVWTSNATAWTYMEGNEEGKTTSVDVAVSVMLPETVTQEDLGGVGVANDAKVAFTVEAIQGNGDVSGAVNVADGDQLANVFANADGDVEITLTDDVVVNDYIELKEGVNATLNLNGKTLSKSEDSGLIIRNYGTLELTGTGTIDGTIGNYAIRNEAGSELIVNEGVVVDGGFGAISCFGGKITINGGDFSNEESNTTHYVVYATNSSTVVINGGTFTFGADQYAGANGSPILASTNGSTIEINGGTFDAQGGSSLCYNANNIVIKGGTFKNRATATYGGTIEGKVAAGYGVTKNADGTWTVDREYTNVTIDNTTDKVTNGTKLADAINATTENAYLSLPAGEYKMPSISGSKEFTIVGTKDTVIDNTMGSYMDDSKVSFEGVTIKGSTGYANGNGSDYAALYTPNVTYTNCTFDGPFRIGRDGATFINCTFTNLGNDYVWTYGNDCTFIGCTFESEGKALLIYSDGGSEVSKVTVKDCVFNATQSREAGAIKGQPCAAIEIHNYGNGVDLTLEGNTWSNYFSGEWRIKDYVTGRPAVIVNGTTYTTIALDGKTMTKQSDGTVVFD